MIAVLRASFFLLVFSVWGQLAHAEDSYADTITVFQNAGESGEFFDTSVGYAVFPTIGKGGIGIGGAIGRLLGPAVGGWLARPSQKWPTVFPADGVFGTFA